MISISKKDNTKQVFDLLNKLQQSSLDIGVSDETATRSDGSLNNAELAAIHDRGAPERNIPARPFMIPGLESAIPHINPHLEAASAALLEKDEARFLRELSLAGSIGATSIQDVIKAGIPPPLKSPVRAGATPLIDTGQLLNSITFTINK